ncbi:hypothetical protein [Flectobacillus longus]|uniref:hypothetical protein n=1 Tax=Flectobacillus longus TaxID=2984207 RepID=UPI0024B85249|nr:hypothetical protein [Flectobacillus longus]MDI9880758.1 hypothetical protein [Flectobacillus longus]
MDLYTTAFSNIITILILKMTCIILGYKVVKLGYNLMIEGVKGNFNFTAEYKGVKAGLLSASPGLLFLTLGIGLMIFSIYVDKGTKTVDKSKQEFIDSVKVKHHKIKIDNPKDSLP